jgi:hypothetical protein
MAPKRLSSALHVSAAVVGLCVTWESIVELMAELAGNFCLRQPQIVSGCNSLCLDFVDCRFEFQPVQVESKGF